MKKAGITMAMLFMTMVMLMAMPLFAISAEPVTLTVEVNDSYQIVDGNGQVYEVADTLQGNDLVENHIGEKAKVTGIIEQDQDVKIMTVTAFQIITE